MKVKDVFLGGSCGNSNWRDDMEQYLKAGGLTFFNPVVEDWNEEAAKEEISHRNSSPFCLYVLSPKVVSLYSVAEVVDDSNKRPDKSVL